jgi:hypothetical protein
MSDSTSISGDISAIDGRLLTAQIQINNDLVTFDQTFYIRAKGKKAANALQNECELEIANLDTATRNYLLTETSPFNQNRTPKILNLYAGRVSTGPFLVYTGDIMTVGISQPPDIMLKLQCGTGHFKKGAVGRRSGGANTKLSTLAGAVASNLGVSLRMEAPNVSVKNYSYSGNALDEVQELASAGSAQAYVDDQHLILKSVNVPLSGSVLNLSAQTGMIGVPEITEQGLKVKFLFDGSVKLGGAINITSVLNPAVNGLFVIFKLDFELSSREIEFYYIAECLKAKT